MLATAGLEVVPALAVTLPLPTTMLMEAELELVALVGTTNFVLSLAQMDSLTLSQMRPMACWSWWRQAAISFFLSALGLPVTASFSFKVGLKASKKPWNMA